MKTGLTAVRKALKAIDPEITVIVAFDDEESHVVRTTWLNREIEQLMASRGFRKFNHEHEGPRWDTTHVLTFVKKEQQP